MASVLLLLTSASPAALAAPRTSGSSTPPGPKTPTAKSQAAANRATFGIAPASSRTTSGRPYFTYDMGAGGSFPDKVAVVNYGHTALDLSVFAADLSNAANGSIGVGLASAKNKDAGGWIHLSHPIQVVHVAPSSLSKGPGRVVLPFEIVVPGDAIPGDHAAAIVATLSTLGKNAKGENVRLDQRIATRVYLRVAGPLRPSLAVDNLYATYHGRLNPIGKGTLAVSYLVHNTGNVRLGARQRLDVSGWFGEAGSVPKLQDIPLLLPGSSAVIHTEVPGVFPQFRLHAKVTLFPLKLQTDSNPAVRGVTATTDTWAIPWSLIALILPVIVAIVGFLYWRRRQTTVPGRGGPASSEATPVGVGS